MSLFSWRSQSNFIIADHTINLWDLDGQPIITYLVIGRWCHL
ncbi:MAG: hypothetical protein WCO29_13340 [Nostocales cyanobacterium ELA583]